ncbi:RHS repeat protein, partial [Clostridium sp. D2Q-11]|nr:RHS repeat protein [Anaeromonas frigoriresistens]
MNMTVRGNLNTVKEAGEVTNQYQFDETNKLVKVINQKGDTSSFTYDGFGNRIKEVTDLNKH